MINLEATIQRIERLIAENTPASVTYAALEARLALERVCYDRLRQHHDYISHDDLRKWQPAEIVKQLVAEIDAHAADTFTLSISTEPAREGVALTEYDYMPVGTQIGFNPNKIRSLWQALSNLALHLNIPASSDESIHEYGDQSTITSKVQEALSELGRLAEGSMTSTGWGSEVSFDCQCGAINKRRASLLRDGQEVSCINPKCDWSWLAKRTGDGYDFEQLGMPVTCKTCATEAKLPVRPLRKMQFGQIGKWRCHQCGEENQVKLIFGQATE